MRLSFVFVFGAALLVASAAAADCASLSAVLDTGDDQEWESAITFPLETKLVLKLGSGAAAPLGGNFTMTTSMVREGCASACATDAAGPWSVGDTLIATIAQCSAAANDCKCTCDDWVGRTLFFSNWVWRDADCSNATVHACVGPLVGFPAHCEETFFARARGSNAGTVAAVVLVAILLLACGVGGWCAFRKVRRRMATIP